MARGSIVLEKAKEQGTGFIWKLAFGLEFLIFFIEIALFGVKLRLGEEAALLVSPWMGALAVSYLGIQVGAVWMSDRISRLQSLQDIIFSFVLVVGCFVPVVFGGDVHFNGYFPWQWEYDLDLFTLDFVRNFGTALVFELLLVTTSYLKLLQMETEISGSRS